MTAIFDCNVQADRLMGMVSDPGLHAIASKVIAGEPVSSADGLSMLATDRIIELGAIADFVRRRLHGHKTYYGVNMNLNYTNVCELRCPLCAFSCDAGDENAYLYSIAEIEERVRQAVAFGIDEVHIVGGLRPDLKIDYFEEMLRTIKRIKPDIFIVAFTATEYDYFARINSIPIAEVFERLMAAGLGALPGGGAEIFNPAVRDVIAPRKISGGRWLDIMRLAHSFGLKTNATMLYNHLESPEDIIDHLSRIRAVQDETGGFKTFVPLAFHEDNTEIRARHKSTTGYDDIRIYATSRVFLHNVPHIKGLWMYLGEKIAQTLLNFGVDDIGATYLHEMVVHSAGATTPDYGTEKFLINLIEAAGKIPVRTASNYSGDKG